MIVLFFVRSILEVAYPKLQGTEASVRHGFYSLCNGRSPISWGFRPVESEKKGGKIVDPGTAYMNQVGRPIGKQDKESLNTGSSTF